MNASCVFRSRAVSLQRNRPRSRKSTRRMSTRRLLTPSRTSATVVLTTVKLTFVCTGSASFTRHASSKFQTTTNLVRHSHTPHSTHTLLTAADKKSEKSRKSSSHSHSSSSSSHSSSSSAGHRGGGGKGKGGKGKLPLSPIIIPPTSPTAARFVAASLSSEFAYDCVQVLWCVIAWPPDSQTSLTRSMALPVHSV